ncbi:MAG: TonB-dependent receptor [Vicinamibacteria bacterium]|nr:TonB-dependent receptor [Vicinamibacteria bacterium]
MRLIRLRFCLALTVAVWLAVPAFSQGTLTGTISGQVVDPDGLPLPGVSVSISSPRLQGVHTAVTTANGDYIFPFLPAGDYTITFDLAGFKPLKVTLDLKLSENRPYNARMSLAGQTEEVTVVGHVSTEFTQTSAVASTYSQDLLDKLPTARTPFAALLLAPGAHQTAVNNAVTISGAMSFENLFLVNGVAVQDNIRNTPLSIFIEDAIQETTVSTAAISAEYGRFAGGVSNAVTKSGGNTFSGSFRTTFDKGTWRTASNYPCDTLNQPVSASCTPTDAASRTTNIVPTYEATLGGPIMKDKLWFFGAARIENNPAGAQTTATNISFINQRNEKRYEGKLTYALNSKHNIKGAYSKIQFDETGNRFGNVMDLASLVNRSLPQDLISANYSGILTPKFFVEAQYSRRRFTFASSGSIFTDLTKGTLFVDNVTGNRYHSPTFCGVCDNEKRDNQTIGGKASYFLSTSNAGSHNLIAGFERFSDQRFSNNHQSGSDYRILFTGTIIQGTDLFPIANNDNSTIIQFNPIPVSSQGNNFKTYSAYVNDTWRFNNNLSFNLGLRYDRNNGANSVGEQVVKDAAFSPRLSVTLDPKGDGEWTISANYGKYVAAIANSVGDSQSPGGQPANFTYNYQGPAINVGNPANPTSQDATADQIFAWFFANGGTDRPFRSAPSVPGLTGRISGTLKSPNVAEYSAGVSRKLGSRGLVRVDGIFRKFQDFYATITDTSTGRVTDPFGRSFDASVTQNVNDPLKRNYKAINAQISYRPTSRLGLGGNYTLSKNYGNNVGETAGGGPSRSGILSFSEYFDVSWNSPIGDLATDQRHRVRVFATWDVPLPEKFGRLTVGGLEQTASGSPYGATGTVDTRPYVTNPGYLNPPSTVGYAFTAPDAFRTETQIRTDLSLNYSHKLAKKSELFIRFTAQNVFDRQVLENLNSINTSVRTAATNSTLYSRFNPFSATPEQGVNWDLGPTFGQPINRFAYTTPRTTQFSVGLRF